MSVELLNVTQTTFTDICSINSCPLMGKYFTYILISSRGSYNSIKVCWSFSQPQMYTVLSLWIRTNWLFFNTLKLCVCFSLFMIPNFRNNNLPTSFRSISDPKANQSTKVRIVLVRIFSISECIFLGHLRRHMDA